MIISFGKHKGKQVEDVSASYLLWFAEQEWADKFEELLEHVEQNRKHLEAEAYDEE
jgi:uncharacterized protein (DUF3820 family)